MRAAAHWIAAIAVGLTACVSPSDPWERARGARSRPSGNTPRGCAGATSRSPRSTSTRRCASEFLALADAFETVRITDYDIGEVDLDEETLAQAEVDVTYRGYVLPQYLEKRVREHQVWYRDEESGNEWRVRPELAAMLDGIGARR